MSVEIGQHLNDHISAPGLLKARSPLPQQPASTVTLSTKLVTVTSVTAGSQSRTPISATTAVASTTSALAGSPTVHGDIGFSYLDKQIIPLVDHDLIEANLENTLP